MPILDGDIQLLQSAVLDDVPEGGGMATGNEVVDGVSNNLFPDISQLDRTYGRISLRKVFPAVLTDTVDGYYGSHVIIAKAPDDPRVSATLFTQGSWPDQRTAAQNRLESYIAMGAESRYSLYGNHLAGQRSVRVHCSKQTPSPGVGDVFVLVQRDDAANFQFFRVTRIVSRLVDQVFSDVTGNYLRDVMVLEIPDPLRMAFEGADVTRYSAGYYDPATRVHATFPADAAAYYGVADLAQVGNVGDLTIRAASIYTQLLPSALSEAPIIDARCAAGREVIVPIELAPALAFSRSVTTAPGEVAASYFGSGVKPGSVRISVGGITLSDDSAGTLVASSGYTGSVDYASGAVALARSTGIGGVVSGTADHAVAVVMASHTAGTAITIGNRGYTYVKFLSPPPAPGSVSVDYMALGRWYSLQDNGSGGIVGDDGVGSGMVDYATGSLSVTLGALPDTGTEVFFAWGSPAHYTSQVGATIFGKPTLTILVPNGGLEPDSLTVRYTAGGVLRTVTDNGVGALEGDGTGWVDYANGKLSMYPSVLPDGGSDVVTTYAQGFLETQVVPIMQQSINFALLNAVKPKTLTLEYQDSLGSHYVVQDDGAGNLFLVSVKLRGIEAGSVGGFGANGGTTSYSLKVEDTSAVGGSINYATGAVSFSGQITLKEESQQRNVFFGSSSWSERSLLSEAAGMLTATYRRSTDNAGAQQTQSQPIEPLHIDLLPTVSNTMVPGSLRFTMAGAVYVDRAGALVKNPSSATNSGVIAGSVNYLLGEVTIEDYAGGGSPVVNVACLTRKGLWDDYEIRFRVSGAPIQPASFAMRANLAADGSQITASSDLTGTISGPDVEGTVDVQFGLVSLRFGRWVADGLLSAQEKAEWWYDAGAVVAGQIFRPKLIFSGTALFNAVSVSNLPLSAAVLGLDPVRLPVDGRVPVLRKGDVLVIHHSATTAPAGVANGQTINLGRVRLARVRVIGANDATITAGYTQDLDAGTVTFTDVTGYSQPVRIEHRIEDMALCSDAQINGDLTMTRPLTHDFPLGSLVSSALIMGDLKARVSHWFDQQTWTGVWSDAVDGPAASSSYNTVQFPIEVTNRGAIQERWRIIFLNTTTVSVIGETVGQIKTNHAISNLLAPINPATGVPYFSIDPVGWGAGWSAGNVVRFNTAAANYPVWVARTVLQGPASQASDSFTIGVRGDVDTP